jgi:hypothetical protein
MKSPVISITKMFKIHLILQTVQISIKSLINENKVYLPNDRYVFHKIIYIILN